MTESWQFEDINIEILEFQESLNKCNFSISDEQNVYIYVSVVTWLLVWDHIPVTCWLFWDYNCTMSDVKDPMQPLSPIFICLRDFSPAWTHLQGPRLPQFDSHSATMMLPVLTLEMWLNTIFIWLELWWGVFPFFKWIPGARVANCLICSTVLEPS